MQHKDLAHTCERAFHRLFEEAFKCKPNYLKDKINAGFFDLSCPDIESCFELKYFTKYVIVILQDIISACSDIEIRLKASKEDLEKNLFELLDRLEEIKCPEQCAKIFEILTLLIEKYIFPSHYKNRKDFFALKDCCKNINLLRFAGAIKEGENLKPLKIREKPMKRKVLLDTSFIVAFLFEKDKYHDEAVEVIKQLGENVELYIHNLVVQEAATVICQRCKERKIDCQKALEIYFPFIRELNLIETSCNNLEILEIMKNLKSSIDTLLVKLAKEHRFEVLTFDQNLKRVLEGKKDL